MVKIIRKTTKGDVTKAILSSIKIAGFISAALVAPNAIGAMEKIGIIQSSKRKNEIINRARNLLIKNGCLEINKEGFICLTKKGEEKLDKYLLDDYLLNIPRIWDEKWRVIIFDIPERRRGLRDKLRFTLQSVGFKKVQNSVWVFPYDCEELITLLKADFKIGKDVLYMVVEKLEGDEKLREIFEV